ncbi:amidase [Acuticoccus sediminis]|uniref:amidase n=1 Tax=Acuticoccus sediminis TaxID=2184697 RepID=UPI001391F896|nr:amidase [Acuticoccus sediminis]
MNDLSSKVDATEIVHLSIADASRLIAARKLSPVELVSAFLARIEATEERLHAYITVLADEAMAAAKVAEAEIAAGRYKGPLHGIPFAVKDNYHVKGVRTTGGSRLMLDYVADETATTIENLVAAGAILLGKLNTWEYGTGNGEVHPDLPFPLARNPWNTDHFTGGSSTGAGVSVAAGSAMFALGSDTGGSVRLPAAAAGVQGMKATYGVVSRAGILPNCWTLDVAGPLTWTSEDNAIVLETMAGYDPRDPQSLDRPVPPFARGIGTGIKGMTIGVVRDLGEDAPPMQAETAANLAAMEPVLRELGATIVDLTLPATLSEYRLITGAINWGESFSIHEKDFMERHHLMGAALKAKMIAGFHMRAVDYIAAQRRRRELAVATDAAIRSVDAVLAPCTLLAAPTFDDQEILTRFTFGAATSIFNVSGHPAISVANGFDAKGLPTSAQFVGRYFDEATLYRLAHAYEIAANTRAVRPSL